MEFARNIRTEEKVALKQSNKEWIDCIAKNFLPQWLNGRDLNVTEVCASEYEKMSELDKSAYGDLPFKPEVTD